MARKVKVAVYMVIEMDVEALEAEFGRSFTNAEARQDLWDSAVSAVQQQTYPQDMMDREEVRVVKLNARPQVK